MKHVIKRWMELTPPRSLHAHLHLLVMQRCCGPRFMFLDHYIYGPAGKTAKAFGLNCIGKARLREKLHAKNTITSTKIVCLYENMTF